VRRTCLLAIKIALFIDGLDEFEGDPRETFGDRLIPALFEWARKSEGNIKICVSSRELPIFQARFKGCPKFRLHELTKGDLYRFTRSKVENCEELKTKTDEEKAQILDLGEEIDGQSNAVFLWASIVVRNLLNYILMDDTIRDMRRKVRDLPNKIDDLFTALFRNIEHLSRSDQARAMQMISLTIVAPRSRGQFNSRSGGIPLIHFTFLDFYHSHENFHEHIEAARDTEDIERRLSRCRKQVEGYCQGLLEVTTDDELRFEVPVKPFYVDITHRSLIEFFQRQDIYQKAEEHATRDFIGKFSSRAVLAELRQASWFMTWTPDGRYFISEIELAKKYNTS